MHIGTREQVVEKSDVQKAVLRGFSPAIASAWQVMSRYSLSTRSQPLLPLSAFNISF
jgi:hypothetical protein